MNFRRCMIMFCRNWSVRSIIIGENRRSAASFCARRQSGSRIYNTYYQIGYPQNASLEEFLCYTDENEHNVMVSRFLSVVRKEQRDRLNKLRVLGDDCIWGEEAPDQGMTFEDRMGQNARHMMETMMEVTKDMCEKINKRDDVFDEFFLEEALPETKEEAGKETLAAAEITTSAENTKKPLFARIFHR